MTELVIRRSAYFPSPGIRRRLSRVWNARLPLACVIGHNPSTADAETEDPTTKWLNRWFEAHGFGGYALVNLYPFCTSSPSECYLIAASAWAGPDWHSRDEMQHNISYVARIAKQAPMVFACWGAIARDDVLISQIVEEIQSGLMPFPDIWCWGKTASGAPTHPMARGKHRIDPMASPVKWGAA
ncbi:DUF1643 domain-containing protein [Polymorphobacter sp.]|uniref:DUF1643 domain-containing protein n=1 Tax=Polymorphobacter sp. TaxID=1909290 RepID=UPI003F6F48AE